MPYVVICMPEPWGSFFCKEFSERLPDVRFCCWGQVTDYDVVDYALVVQPEEGQLEALTNLKAIIVIGAGADHVLGLPSFPDVPIARLPQPDMRQRMTEYVLMHVLRVHRYQSEYLRQQQKKKWQMIMPQPIASDRKVLVLGAGYLGLHAAEALNRVGFDVAIWSRRVAKLEGVRGYSGVDQLLDILQQTDVLVSLLPLTPSTDSIISFDVLHAMPKGSFLINASRGGVVDDRALLSCLDSGQIAEAVLDAFVEEPLSEDHPYWEHPRVVLTPHCASAAMPDAVAPVFEATISSLERGQKPPFQVIRERGY